MFFFLNSPCSCQKFPILRLFCLPPPPPHQPALYTWLYVTLARLTCPPPPPPLTGPPPPTPGQRKNSMKKLRKAVPTLAAHYTRTIHMANRPADSWPT